MFVAKLSLRSLDLFESLYRKRNVKHEDPLFDDWEEVQRIIVKASLRYKISDYDREDIVQAVFEKILDQANKKDKIRCLRSWIFIVTRNECLNHFRIQKHKLLHGEAYRIHKETLDPCQDQVIEEKLNNEKYFDYLEEKIHSSNDDRDVVKLFYSQNLKAKEISTMTDTNINTVLARLRRFRLD